MGRVLTLQRSIVPLSERKKFMQKLQIKQKYYTGANCHFWVFEESDLAGAFVEFIEAADIDTLEKALAEAPNRIADVGRIFTGRIYQEVELE